LAILSLQNLISSSSVALSPYLSATKAFTVSPRYSPGTPRAARTETEVGELARVRLPVLSKKTTIAIMGRPQKN
jgi:hypothetical protein